MKDYLNVIITNGEKEVQWQGLSVPRSGDHIHVRNEMGDMYLEGQVGSVTWTYRTHMAGAVVTVWVE